jgi:hypothetical protein
MRGPSGFLVYRKEGSKTVYLGRRSLEEIKRMLAKADAEAIQRIRSDVEAVKRALEGQTAAQTTAQARSAPSLTWRKDGHTYWLLQYGRTFYVYMKGPSTRHRPKLVEKTDVDGVIGRVLAAGAAHVVEALRLLVNGLHAAVEDLLKRPAAEAQRPRSEPIPRREAEEALRELRRELARAVKRWGERWSEGGGGLWGPDPGWLRERLSEFLDENIHLVEKILPHRDLAGKFADAVEEETRGYILGGDVLRMLRELGR